MADAGQRDIALKTTDQRAQQIEQSGFPGSGRSRHCDEIAFFNGERNAPEDRLALSIRKLEIFDFDQRIHLREKSIISISMPSAAPELISTTSSFDIPRTTGCRVPLSSMTKKPSLSL